MRGKAATCPALLLGAVRQTVKGHNTKLLTLAQKPAKTDDSYGEWKTGKVKEVVGKIVRSVRRCRLD